MKKSSFGKRILNAAAVVGLVGACTLGVSGAANAAPAGGEWVTSWTITGNTATGTTPSGVTVTAKLTGPATFTADKTALGAGADPAKCATGPSGCGSITYTFSKPVTSPFLETSGAGSSQWVGNVYGSYSNAPVTLTSGGTFSVDQAGQNTANEIRNNGTTVGMTQAALNANIGKTSVNGSSCDTSSAGGVNGCGTYLINTGTPTVTSITMGLGYANDTTGDGTRPGTNRYLKLGIVPVAEASVPMIDPAILGVAGAGAAVAAAGGLIVAARRKKELTTTN